MPRTNYYGIEAPVTAVPVPAVQSEDRARRRAVREWSIEDARYAMNDYGFSTWTVNYLIPGPYPRRDTTLACEATQVMPNGQINRHIFTFRGASHLEIYENFDEVDYINAVRRTGKDLTPYYKAVQEGRRKLVAKVLAAGGEVQLLLPPVVDDDELRGKLSTPAYRKAQFVKDASVKVKQKMNKIRQERYDEIPAECKTIPQPETERGRRAVEAAIRGRDRQARRERNRPAVAVPVLEGEQVSPNVQTAFARPARRIRGLDVNNGRELAFDPFESVVTDNHAELVESEDRPGDDWSASF